MSVDLVRWRQLWQETFIRDCPVLETRQRLTLDNTFRWRSLAESHGLAHELSRLFDELEEGIAAIAERHEIQKRAAISVVPLVFPVLDHIADLLGVPGQHCRAHDLHGGPGF